MLGVLLITLEVRYAIYEKKYVMAMVKLKFEGEFSLICE